MGRVLDDNEITDLNEVITHCERLINARGRQNATFGLFETAAFSVMAKRDADRYGVQVRHRGESVLQVEWALTAAGDAASPGHAVFDPGAWRAELLRVPALHA